MRPQVQPQVSFAKLVVQPDLSEGCSATIKNTLQNIHQLQNIRIFPKDNLITFHFRSVNSLSTALNALTDIGYDEI